MAQASVNRPSGRRSVNAARRGAAAAGDPTEAAQAIVAELKAAGTAENRAGMARFGITGNTAGVSLAAMKPIVKRYARNHALAAALWQSGLHEARIMACDLDEPAKVTPQQMDQWAADFDNWALYRRRLPASLRQDALHRRQDPAMGGGRARIRAPRRLLPAGLLHGSRKGDSRQGVRGIS